MAGRRTEVFYLRARNAHDIMDNPEPTTASPPDHKKKQAFKEHKKGCVRVAKCAFYAKAGRTDSVRVALIAAFTSVDVTYCTSHKIA